MSANIVKYAFVAGEISPTLFGRTDLTKYDLGLAKAQNFFVDFRGGLSSRPGTEFIDSVSTNETRMFTFAFAPDVANSYVVLFGDHFIRFYQDGGLVLSGGVAYVVTTPFGADDLEGLTVEQYRDLLRITSQDFPIYNLVRHDHTNWELAEEDVSPFVPGPTITGSSASTTGSASVIFAVTKVMADGTESAAGPPTKISNIVNYTATEGAVSITWAADPDAIYYNIYRSVVATTEVLSSGSPLGYVGRAHGTKFTDSNIVPDFTNVPPTFNNPFAPGAIEKIAVTNGGSTFTDFTAGVSIADPNGSSFLGQAIVEAGEVTNVLVKYGGDHYSAPTVNFSGGTGATGVATVRPLEGTYPALSCVFQQRQIYAASLNDPVTLWGSRIKQFSNFASSDFVLDDDSFEFTLDTNSVAPINHLIVTRGGLLAMTQGSVWLLSGSSGGLNSPLTPTNALAEPQSYSGISDLKPISVGNDILFQEAKGRAVHLLTYNDLYKTYSSEDKSILSSHLFGTGKRILRWGFQESPYKVVWCVREDGALLAFTTIQAEDVFAWTPGSTKGRFTDLVVLQEGNDDRVYVTVERKINGTWVKYLERFNLRDYLNIEDAWCVDCGLSLPAFYPSGTVTFFNNNGAWTAVTSIPQSFTVGEFIRGGNGIFKITAGSGSNYVLEMFAEPTNYIPESGDTETFEIAQGAWTCDTPVTTLAGLDHLEGELVSILADGNVFTKQIVTGGTIVLDAPVTRAIVGLGFSCQAQTLPMIVPNAAIEARRKRVVGIGIRMDKSRGIKIGPTLNRMSPLRERSTETYGHSTRVVNGMTYQLIHSEWNSEGQTYFVQDDPLPVNILSIVSDIEVGDEPD